MLKKVRVFALLLVLVFAIIPLFSGCRYQKPWTIEETAWVSEDPEIKLIQHGTDCNGYVICNQERIAVKLLWSPTLSIWIVNQDDDLPSDESKLFSGRFTYNNVKVTITEVLDDKLFGNKYETITLYRKSVDSVDLEN